MTEDDDTQGNEPVVRLYTRRLPWTPAAVVGLLFVVVGFAMTRSVSVCGTRGCVPGPLGGAACIVLGAPVALAGLYYVFTPIPLLNLNRNGMLYQKFPLKIERVRWEDVQLIRAYSQLTIIPSRHSRTLKLDLTITYTPRAVNANGGRRWEFFHFDGADLPVPPQQLVEQIRSFHPVQYVDGGEQDITQFRPLNRRGKPSRQARWATRHPAETRHQNEGANDS